MNQLPVDFYFAVIARMAVPDLLRMRQIEELTDCVDHELRRREFEVNRSNYPTAADMHSYLNVIAPLATRATIDFEDVDVSFAVIREYLAAVLDFLNTCKGLTHLSLNRLPQEHLSPAAVKFGNGLSRIRSLRIGGRLPQDANDERTSQFLRACSRDVLADLTLIKCVQTGECLSEIPGQLRSLHLECNHDKMQWRHLYEYVRQNPELRALTVIQHDTLDLSDLCPYLQHVTALRLHTGTADTQQTGFAALAQLVDLHKLDVRADGDGLVSYICRLTERHQLAELRMELTNFTFTEISVTHLQRLTKLHTIEVSIGMNVHGITHLLKSLGTMSGLRTVSLFPGTDMDMPREVTAVAVQQNLQHVENLRIELIPQKLEVLSRMPRLRSLQLCIDNRFSRSAKRRRKQHSNTNRFLRSVCRANGMKKLRLESKGDLLAVDERMLAVEFARFTELHTLELAMQTENMRQFRSARPVVKNYREDLPLIYREECWD